MTSNLEVRILGVSNQRDRAMKVTETPIQEVRYTIHDLTLAEISLLKALIGICTAEETETVDIHELWKELKAGIGGKEKEFRFTAKGQSQYPILNPRMESE